MHRTASTATITFAGTPLGVDELEEHRGTLVRHCRRMLGSAFEAEDAVQETFVRAWRNRHRFERRSSVRTWLCRIATNVCFDMRCRPSRRAVAVDLVPGAGPELPDERGKDPAEEVASKDAVTQAFVAALQHLPARQRAVLILFDVLRWRASEIAELLGTTEAAVNSALQRGRATLSAVRDRACLSATMAPAHRELLARYVEAFEHSDVASLVSLVRTESAPSRPPRSTKTQA